jgi:hypothetical protein
MRGVNCSSGCLEQGDHRWQHCKRQRDPAILLHQQKGKRGEGVSTLLIKNAKNIITMDKERSQFPGGSLYAEGQQILAIGTDLPYETADTVIDTLCIQASSTPITTCIRR